MSFDFDFGEWGMGNGGKRGKTKFKREKEERGGKLIHIVYISYLTLLYCFVIPLNAFVIYLSIFLSSFLLILLVYTLLASCT